MVFIPMGQSEENQEKSSKSASVSATKNNDGSSAPTDTNPKNNDNFDTVSVASSVGTRRGFVPLDDDTEMLCLNEDAASQRSATSNYSPHGFVSKSVSTTDVNLIDDSVDNADVLGANLSIPETVMKLPVEEELLKEETTVDDDNTAHSSHDKNFLSNSSPVTSNSESVVNVCFSPDFLDQHNSSANTDLKLFVPKKSSIDFNFKSRKTITPIASISPGGLSYSPISTALNNTSMEVNVSGSFLNQSPKTIATDDTLPAPVDNSGDNANSLVGKSNDKSPIRDLSPTGAYAPLHPNVKHLFELANGTFIDRTRAISSVATNESLLSNSQISASNTHTHYLNLGRGKKCFYTQNLPSSSSLISIADKVKPHVDDPNDCIAIRNMKRWFYQIDLMLSSLDPKSNDQTDNFYLGLISKAKDYSQKLSQLADLPEITNAYFSEITIYLERLKEYVSMLDRLLREKNLKDELEKFTAKACIDSISGLNRYDGNILNWPIFWASYQNMIFNNSTLSEFAKFRLLYDNVDGMTRMLLQDIDPTNPDLQLAFTRICSHFDNHDTVLYGLNSVLKNIPFVKNSCRMENWFMLMENTMMVKRFLIGKKEETDSEYEKECVIILLGKLAPKHTEDYFKISEIDWKFNHFIAYCQKKISGLQRLSYLGVDLDSIVFSEWLCPICKNDYHFPERCDLSLEDRKEKVRANRLCFKCLEVEYFHGHCCQQQCTNCEGDHHLALCHSYRPHSKGNQSDHNKLNYSSSSRGYRLSAELVHVEMPEVDDIEADQVDYRKT